MNVHNGPMILLCILLSACGVHSGNDAASGVKPTARTGAASRSTVIDYTVPNRVFIIAQNKTMGCWATTSAILVSWKEKKLVPVEEMLGRVSEKYRILYDTDAGLLPPDQPDLIKPLGLTQEAPQNYSVDGWLSLLKRFGPLWVTTAFPKPNDKWGLHARVVSGIKGDGTPDGTTLHVYDPAEVKESDITITDFTKEMENVAKADKALDIRPMVIHF